MGFPFPYEQWALASRDRFFRLVAGADCPYVDEAKLRRSYDALARTNPLFLWRRDEPVPLVEEVRPRRDAAANRGGRRHEAEGMRPRRRRGAKEDAKGGEERRE